MRAEINSPIYALTSDVDWASEACIADLLGIAGRLGIKPTVYATHKSACLEAARTRGEAEVGVHPNFRPGSTHGADPETVIEHVLGLVPDAKTFRSHSFVDSSPITEIFVRRGFKHDSNLCLYLQDNCSPLRHSSGLMRFPVFWEDDVHWTQNGDWSVDRYLDRFTSPGLKVINVHPVHLALNTPSAAFYRGMSTKPDALTADIIESSRHAGAGTRSLVLALLERLTGEGHRFYTMSELYELFAPSFSLDAHDPEPRSAGRHTQEDHAKYWQGSDVERQSALKDVFDGRDPLDPYATSRDHNQRELEITAIMRALEGCQPGRLVDLGCGNGHTLLSLAAGLRGWDFEGIDFSKRLIEGAHALTAQRGEKLLSEPRFLCGDAVDHIRRQEDASLDAVLTERFLLNLPSRGLQHEVIREVHRALKPGGILLMCEGSMEGFRNLNDLRSALGLEPIPETSADNLSSMRFEDLEIESFVTREAGFELIAKHGFSFFFAVSRALYPAQIAPQRPKFDARINTLAREIQCRMPLQPGVGSNVLWVLAKRDADHS